ncbi:hypothetical protein Plhal304r1_c034g0106561 [Plasmopara halstedii]
MRMSSFLLIPTTAIVAGCGAVSAYRRPRLLGSKLPDEVMSAKDAVSANSARFLSSKPDRVNVIYAPEKEERMMKGMDDILNLVRDSSSLEKIVPHIPPSELKKDLETFGTFSIGPTQLSRSHDQYPELVTRMKENVAKATNQQAPGQFFGLLPQNSAPHLNQYPVSHAVDHTPQVPSGYSPQNQHVGNPNGQISAQHQQIGSPYAQAQQQHIDHPYGQTSAHQQGGGGNLHPGVMHNSNAANKMDLENQPSVDAMKFAKSYSWTIKIDDIAQKAAAKNNLDFLIRLQQFEILRETWLENVYTWVRRERPYVLQQQNNQLWIKLKTQVQKAERLYGDDAKSVQHIEYTLRIEIDKVSEQYNQNLKKAYYRRMTVAYHQKLNEEYNQKLSEALNEEHRQELNEELNRKMKEEYHPKMNEKFYQKLTDDYRQLMNSWLTGDLTQPGGWFLRQLYFPCVVTNTIKNVKSAILFDKMAQRMEFVTRQIPTSHASKSYSSKFLLAHIDDSLLNNPPDVVESNALDKIKKIDGGLDNLLEMTLADVQPLEMFMYLCSIGHFSTTDPLMQTLEVYTRLYNLDLIIKEPKSIKLEDITKLTPAIPHGMVDKFVQKVGNLLRYGAGGKGNRRVQLLRRKEWDAIQFGGKEKSYQTWVADSTMSPSTLYDTYRRHVVKIDDLIDFYTVDYILRELFSVKPEIPPVIKEQLVPK